MNIQNIKSSIVSIDKYSENKSMITNTTINTSSIESKFIIIKKYNLRL